MLLVYLDLETSGLDPSRDVVLEIAVSLADLSSPFDARAAYHAVLRYNAGASEALDPFVREMHTKNGLLAECLRGRDDFAKVEEELLALVPEVADRDETPTLAGSSVHFDHGFLRDEFPRFAARLSHRHYDVSAVKLFCRSLGMPRLPRAEAHRAREDVLESVEHARLCARWLAEEFANPGHVAVRDALVGIRVPVPGPSWDFPVVPDPRIRQGSPIMIQEDRAMPKDQFEIRSLDLDGTVVDAVRVSAYRDACAQQSAENEELRRFKEAALDVLREALDHPSADEDRPDLWPAKAGALVRGRWDSITGYGSGSRDPLVPKTAKEDHKLARRVVPLGPGEQAPPEAALAAPPAGYRWETWEERRARLKGSLAGG